MSTKASHVTVELSLNYLTGTDEPTKGIYRNSVVPPKHGSELAIVAQRPAETFPDLAADPDVDLRPQVHIVGSARALEELGKYLIALARLETADPEPYGVIDGIQDGSGGTLRLLPRRRRHEDGSSIDRDDPTR